MQRRPATASNRSPRSVLLYARSDTHMLALATGADRRCPCGRGNHTVHPTAPAYEPILLVVPAARPALSTDREGCTQEQQARLERMPGDRLLALAAGRSATVSYTQCMRDRYRCHGWLQRSRLTHLAECAAHRPWTTARHSLMRSTRRRCSSAPTASCSRRPRARRWRARRLTRSVSTQPPRLQLWGGSPVV